MSGSSSSADLALNKARALQSKASGAPPKSSARRAFFEHLITLASIRSLECKEYFGRHIGDFFSELEDLQDKAVDAILDLCEDDLEPARIIGIKGLGTTARADARWVRGNAGVLLQLLECPPSELYHVKEVLRTLLDISPGEVFAVMADDCRGSEEETGASRRIILDYLETDLKDVREKVLHSGNNVEAERSFREGFMSVVKVAPPEESRLALSLLLPLSTVSGKNKSQTTTTQFARAVINAESSSAIFGLFDKLCTKNPPIDPRLLYLFFAKHGTRLVNLGVRERDRTAMGLVEELRTLMEDTMREFKVGARDDDLAVETLGKKYCRKVLQSLLDTLDEMGKKRIKLDSSIELVEILLYSIYRILLIRDFRRDLVDREYRADLDHLIEDAQYAIRKVKAGSKEDLVWRNVRDISEMLEEPRNRLRNIDPSWRSKDVAPPPPAPLNSSARGREAPPHFKEPSRAPAAPAWSQARENGRAKSPSENEALDTKIISAKPNPPADSRQNGRLATGISKQPTKSVDTPTEPPIAVAQSSKPATDEGKASSSGGLSLLQRLGPSIVPQVEAQSGPSKSRITPPIIQTKPSLVGRENYAGQELLSKPTNGALEDGDNFAGKDLLSLLPSSNKSLAQTPVMSICKTADSLPPKPADDKSQPRVFNIKRPHPDDNAEPGPRKVTLLSRLAPRGTSDSQSPAQSVAALSSSLSSRLGQRISPPSTTSSPPLPRQSSGISVKGHADPKPPLPKSLSISGAASAKSTLRAQPSKSESDDMETDDSSYNRKGRGFTKDVVDESAFTPRSETPRTEVTPWRPGGGANKGAVANPRSSLKARIQALPLR